MRLRILISVLISCAMGFVLGFQNKFEIARFLWTLIGTGLLSGGACTLNCFIEREYDAIMPRTSSRPIPAGIISPLAALLFGLSLVTAGWALLVAKANLVASLFGLTAVIVYLLLYTPAKRLTWWNTSIGAIPGAIPPLIGWGAATGTVGTGGWFLFAILFIWQHTHFFPIAWLFRDDYERAGFNMLPVLEKNAKKTFHLTIFSAIALLAVSLSMCATGLTGTAYCLSALAGGGTLLAAGIRLLISPSAAEAKSMIRLSVVYLPVILSALIFDRSLAAGNIGEIHVLSTVWPWI